MTATVKQLAALKKARAAKKKTGSKKATSINNVSRYIVKITRHDNRVGYAIGDGKFDTDKTIALGMSVKDAEKLARTIHREFKDYVHRVEVLKK